MAELIESGCVWLVGAGPGDPDLLTRKAERLIAAADIVFHDALVGTGVLDLIPAGIERISVGKRSGRHSKDQGSINDLIVCRSAEEVQACATHGVPVRICPGVTTASAAAASAGVSLTLRGLARKLTFITAHARAGEALDLDWNALADPQATLAIYMGRSVARELSARLQDAGLSAATPVMVIENVSLPSETIVRTRLDLLALAIPPEQSGPTIILVGQALASTLACAGEEERRLRTVCSNRASLRMEATTNEVSHIRETRDHPDRRAVAPAHQASA
jgi:uroporphyrin-III C-methyltransferase